MSKTATICFVDCWNYFGESSPDFAKAPEKWALSKNRYVYKVDSSLFLNACEKWFDSRCTLLGCCTSDINLNAYVSHGYYIPDKALRHGFLSAFIGGDANGEGYSIGCEGQHPELIQELVEFLRPY